jgi:two-component system sensor histidine kinase RcsD
MQCGAGIIAMEKVIYSQATTLEIQLLPFILPYPLKAWPSRVNISMSQSETTAPSKFSLLPGSITRFFLLLIVVLLVTMGVMVQSAVNAWLKDKSYQVVDITHAVHKRIDTWRYATWQIYDNIAAAPATSSGEGYRKRALSRTFTTWKNRSVKQKRSFSVRTTAQRLR